MTMIFNRKALIAFVAFLATKQGEYHYVNRYACPFALFLREIKGYPTAHVESHRFFLEAGVLTPLPLPAGWIDALLERPWTYGALYKRFEAML